MADTTRSVDILIQGRDNARPAIESSTNALSKLNETLHASQNSLRGFNAILELSLGFHVGRFLFEKIHEGVLSFAEGANEARKAGEGLFESL